MELIQEAVKVAFGRLYKVSRTQGLKNLVEANASGITYPSLDKLYLLFEIGDALGEYKGLYI